LIYLIVINHDYFLFLGRSHEVKRLNTLLDAMNLIKIIKRRKDYFYDHGFSIHVNL